MTPRLLTDKAVADYLSLPLTSAPPVDQDGTRVLIRGRRFHTFMSETGAARVAAALQTLSDYGLLDRVECE